MTEKKPEPSSDAARTSEDADKNRENLVKEAEKGIDKAKDAKSSHSD